jgi:putative cell wall-binding protein
MRSLLVAVLLALVAAPVAAQHSGPDPGTRLDAGDTVEAALAWSRYAVPDGGAPTVLLARDDDFADALASGGMQGALRAPLLLTPSAQLDPRVDAELDRVGAERVVILGGRAAVSAEVERSLTDSGRSVARAFGDPADPTRGFADSLGAGALSATTGWPLAKR